MGRNRNIRSRKKLLDALEEMEGTFTSVELAEKAGLHVRQVSTLLREVSFVEKIPIKRTRNLRVIYKIRE
jgi:hypothetical protein